MYLRKSGYSKKDIEEMGKAEFIATIIKLQEMENPNFKRDEFLVRENYFVGYEEDRQKYFERKRKKK